MSKAQLFQKIHKVMQDIEYLQKDDKVNISSSNSYKAISEEKVTMAVREALIKHGLVIMPVEQEHLKDQILGKDGEPKGFLTTVNTKYEICDIDTGECKTIVSSGTGVDTQDKGVGKAMTYSFKYLLLRTFAIPTGEDPDKVASSTWDDQFTRPTNPTQPPQTRNDTPPSDDDQSALQKASDANMDATKFITSGQVKMLWAKAYAAGYRNKNEDLMQMVSTLVGYPVKSFEEVEKKDLNAVAKQLDKQKSA